MITLKIIEYIIRYTVRVVQYKRYNKMTTLYSLLMIIYTPV